MNEDELDGFTADELVGIFMYAANHKLRLNENGLVPGLHDPDDLRTVGTLCILINRLTDERNTVVDGTVNALAVLAAALVTADECGLPRPALVHKWHKTLAVANKLQLADKE